MNRVFRFLYGQISFHEFSIFSGISLAFFCATSAYWILRPVKQGLFYGLSHGSIPAQRYEAFILMGVVVGLILMCSKLADKISLYKILSGLCGIYFVAFGLVAQLMKFPSFDVENPSILLTKVLYWVFSLSVGSFGVVIFALLWAFFTSALSWEAIKKGLFLVVAASTLGGIFGPYFVARFIPMGLPFLIICSSVLILCIPLSIAIFSRAVCGDGPACKVSAQERYAGNDQGYFGGLRLLARNHFLIGIVVLIALTKFMQEILRYFQLSYFSQNVQAGSFVGALAYWGIVQSLMVLFVALFALSLMIRKGVMTTCLLLYPIALALVFAILFVVSFNQLFWILFSSAATLAQAINRPAIELLYVSTSLGARLKSRLWIQFIDVFFIGFFVKMFLKLNFIGTLSFLFLAVLFVLLGIWVLASYCMGTAFERRKA